MDVLTGRKTRAKTRKVQQLNIAGRKLARSGNQIDLLHARLHELVPRSQLAKKAGNKPLRCNIKFRAMSLVWVRQVYREVALQQTKEILNLRSELYNQSVAVFGEGVRPGAVITGDVNDESDDEDEDDDDMTFEEYAAYYNDVDEDEEIVTTDDGEYDEDEDDDGMTFEEYTAYYNDVEEEDGENVTTDDGEDDDEDNDAEVTDDDEEEVTGNGDGEEKRVHHV